MTSPTTTSPGDKEGIGTRKDYHALNAQLNLFDESGQIQFDRDKQAIGAYVQQWVKPRTRRFDSVTQRLEWLVDNDYYETDFLQAYDSEFLSTVHQRAAEAGHRFGSFLGAFKFYTSYAMKTFDGREYLEDFSERVVATALYLARGDEKLAVHLVDEMMSGRYQPATPTFLNAGKKQRGELVSCFLLRVEDNMESIGRSVNSALQLSKRGGGVALMLTNLRQTGAPIKKTQNQASGVVPVMKILEDSFSYANQLGARQGAGAVYLHAHHPDILRFLDTKRENADEKVRIKTLSLGVVIPDVTFRLAKEDRDMLLFSPYDIEREYGKPMSDLSITALYDELAANPRIHKDSIRARDFFTTIAELQFESGYPYVLFDDTVNRDHAHPGRIGMSNLCSEILQTSTPSTMGSDLSYESVGRDISCNLGSLNIAAAMTSPHFGRTVETAVRALTSVSDQCDVDAVPSVARGNRATHAIGLGQMNLHGYLASQNIRYGSTEAIDFTDAYFRLVTFHAIRASHLLAVERGETFEGFASSDYANGVRFERYVSTDGTPATDRVRSLFAEAGVHLPSREDWIVLRAAVMRDGMYNAYLQAIPPTGSISYINHSTASLHPVTSRIEIRKEGKLGRVYYPAPHMSQENIELFEDAYEVGYEKIIDTYAAATKHVDQGLSLTLFFKDDTTTRDINRAQIYAWKAGIKTLYYIRLRQAALEGTEVQNCVSCAL
ncbi:class 1b ribonucleoside-diphosphate reductase subunit alpha [Kocuria sp. TGY1127_2]|uniref:class 1b ribonucleoside-diphosphate reductase subunit alpha n=1 Tax=Kocuria sp. TGY1127_2 TaxID=2711328 RepID=UPI0015B7B3E5|nr:class 1b ribonucleoside-diphosphate reductase subunit alpha [Kocuria sp. TGY1127_2]